MSDFDPGAFRMETDRWTGKRVLVCSRGHRREVRTWVGDEPTLRVVDDEARGHWRREHA
jgi:hypothetical protein